MGRVRPSQSSSILSLEAASPLSPLGVDGEMVVVVTECAQTFSAQDSALAQRGKEEALAICNPCRVGCGSGTVQGTGHRARGQDTQLPSEERANRIGHLMLGPTQQGAQRSPCPLSGSPPSKAPSRVTSLRAQRCAANHGPTNHNLRCALSMALQTHHPRPRAV